MSRALLILNTPEVRAKAQRWCADLPVGTRVVFQEAKRTGIQNDKMWAMLTELSGQTKWHGAKLSPDDWKLLFMSGLEKELRIVPNLAGDGFVNLGGRSSQLSKAEMIDLIEMIYEFGARNGVTFREAV